MDQVESTAPAQEIPAAPPSAIDQAVEKHDVSTFRDARLAERTGKPYTAQPDSTPEPLPEPEPEPQEPEPKPAATAQPATPGISKRQQQINDYERRIAEQDQRIRALEAQQQTPAAPRSEPAPTEPEYKRFRAMPDAPKLDQFESIEDHAAAMALFIADKRFEERDAKAKQESAQASFFKEQDERTRAFQARVDEAKKTDPAFWDHVSPDVKGLRPRADLRPGEAPTAANDLADELLDHEQGPRLMLYLTDHPDVLHRLTAIPSRSQLYRELGRLYATFEQPAPASPPTKTVSSAPEPVITVGKKASEPANEIEAAVAANDVSLFREKRRQAAAAALKR